MPSMEHRRLPPVPWPVQAALTERPDWHRGLKGLWIPAFTRPSHATSITGNSGDPVAHNLAPGYHNPNFGLTLNSNSASDLYAIRPGPMGLEIGVQQRFNQPALDTQNAMHSDNTDEPWAALWVGTVLDRNGAWYLASNGSSLCGVQSGGSGGKLNIIHTAGFGSTAGATTWSVGEPIALLIGQKAGPHGENLHCYANGFYEGSDSDSRNTGVNGAWRMVLGDNTSSPAGLVMAAYWHGVPWTDEWAKAITSNPMALVTRRPLTVSVGGGFAGELTAAVFNMTAQALTLTADYAAEITAADFDMSGEALTVEADYAAELGAASFSFTAQALDLQADFAGELSAPAFKFTGESFETNAAWRGELTAAAFNVTAQPITLGIPITQELTAAAFNFTGHALTIPDSGAEQPGLSAPLTDGAGVSRPLTDGGGVV